MRIAIDLDNTVISYHDLFLRSAVALGYIGMEARHAKTELRDYLRTCPDGERKWQQLQAFAYGPGIEEARAFDGVREFLLEGRKRDAQMFVVSHKTQYATADEKCDIRSAALGWLRKRGFIGPSGVAETNVYFEGTRAEKIDRIRSLECTHVIDDLVEVFCDPAFPHTPARLLFALKGGGCDVNYEKVCSSWATLREAVFGVASV